MINELIIMLFIYAASMPISYAMCGMIYKSNKAEFDAVAAEDSPYFLFKIISVLPIINTVVSVYGLKFVFKRLFRKKK